MDNKQMKMVSVKSTMERMIQAMIASYEPLKDADAFFTAVERMVAGLFASQQIDNNYLVRPSGKNIEIKFSTGGHYSCLTYMLPPSLEWKVNIKPKVVVEATGPHTEQEHSGLDGFGHNADNIPVWQFVGAGGGGGAGGTGYSVGGTAGFTVAAGGSGQLRGTQPNVVIRDAYDPYDPSMETEDYIFPRTGTGKGSKVTTLATGSLLPEISEPKAVTNRALDAYEKAKKAVEQM